MDKMAKARVRRQLAALREMWAEFDPIGVMGDPSAPRDEYDSYVGPTLRRLTDGASVKEIADFLDALVTKNMGFKPDQEETERFARRLDAWFGGEGEG